MCATKTNIVARILASKIWRETLLTEHVQVMSASIGDLKHKCMEKCVFSSMKKRAHAIIWLSDIEIRGLVWALELYGATQIFLCWLCVWHTCTLRAFIEKVSWNRCTIQTVSAFIRIRSDTHWIIFQFFFVWPMYRHFSIIIFHTSV